MPIDKSKKKSVSKNTVRVDFTDTEVRSLLPEGQYRLKVGDVELKTSESSGNDYLNWTFITLDDDAKLNNQKVWYITSLVPSALWNLRNLLEVLGIETPNGPLDLDLDEYKDLECLGTIEHETYEGKKRAKVTDFESIDEVAKTTDDDAEGDDGDEESEDEGGEEAEDAEDEEETDQAEEEEKLSRDEVKAMTIDELKDLVKERKLDIKKPSDIAKKFRGQVMDALEASGQLGD